ncbi:hypothetical protein D3C86_964390 [compost metagenome]
MPDVRLHGAQSAVLAKHLTVPGFPVQFLEGRLQAVHFDGIAKRRPRSVRFNIGDRARINPRLGVRRLQQFGLRLRVRRRQRICSPPVVHCRAADYAINMIAVPFRCTQPLQKQNPGSFAGCKAIGIVRERLTSSFFTQSAGLIIGNMALRCYQRIDASGYGHFTGAILNSPGRIMNSHK